MEIPPLSLEEIAEYLAKAHTSERHRAAKVLHQKGDYLNRVFNFVLADSYMQPHHHSEIEHIAIVEGKMAVVFFDDTGNMTHAVILEKPGESVDVPSFAWHTYVAPSNYTVSYETMEGIYDPVTWKNFASWAPAENGPKASKYLMWLKEEAVRKIKD